jgi:hypothetical protein
MAAKRITKVCCIAYCAILFIGLSTEIGSAQGTAEPIYRALNPAGSMPQVNLVPLAPRLSSVEGKTIYVITLASPRDAAADSLASKVADALAKRNANVVRKKKETTYSSDDKPLWDEVQKNANAFVYFATAQSSTTTFSVLWAAGLEKRGVPGVTVIFDFFSKSAWEKREMLGTMLRIVTAPLAFATATEKQITDIVEETINALTRSLEERETKTGPYLPPRPPRIAIQGTEDQIQKHFYDSGWTDGLPIIVPTEEKVAWMLKGTSHKPDEIVTRTMWPGPLEVTVEKVAIVGVMAGCKPEYMPVLLAAAEAFGSGNNAATVVSTNSFSYMQVVNGPIAKQIGMNAGIYALGPGNQANATIGRALRLFVHSLGGGRVGENIMGAQGNASAYAFCFAENEERSPWEPFHVNQGYKGEESTITIFNGGWSHVGNYIFEGMEGIEKLSQAIAQFEWTPGVVILMSPPKAKLFSSKGLSKQDMEQRIWEGATLQMKRFKDSTYWRSFIAPDLKGKLSYGWPKEYLDKPDDAIVQVYPRKEVRIIVVGGEVADMMQAWRMSGPTTVSIDKWR